MLSPQLLMHAVQNPRMPLRFIVQAMFVEQLNTRRTVVSAADHSTRHHPNSEDSAATLGAILQRDAALRQAAHLKASMDATTSRIQSLEKELDGMKKLLQHESANRRIVQDSGRCRSFRFSSDVLENKIERGQKGSVSSSSLGVFTRRERFRVSSSSEASTDGPSPAVEKSSFGRKLVNRLKGAFRSSNSTSKKNPESTAPSKVSAECGGEAYENGDVILIKKDHPFHHHRVRSLG
ncbi:hypothetical protein U1Q18_011965 [Sarracenia purpurea var. burkii]